jgi:hypothetical protein
MKDELSKRNTQDADMAEDIKQTSEILIHGNVQME